MKHKDVTVPTESTPFEKTQDLMSRLVAVPEEETTGRKFVNMVQKKPGSTRDAIEKIIGDPSQIDLELQELRRDTNLLSSQADIIDKYPKRWIAIYNGTVQADARSLKEVLAAIDTLGLPRASVIVRYVDRNLRAMIL